MTINDMKKDIEKAKKRLAKKTIVENFGQNEVRKIKDKYSCLMIEEYAEYSRIITGFSEWCATYTG